MQHTQKQMQAFLCLELLAAKVVAWLLGFSKAFFSIFFFSIVTHF